MDDDVSPSSNEAEQPSSSLSWRPRQLLFVPYALQNPQTSRVPARKSIVSKLTKDIVETYRLCNPLFKYSDELNLKRFLTSPSVGVLNDGYDNSNSDLILSVNFVMVNSDSQRRYIVKDMLGQGTFGQVAKCWVAETSSFVAVKVIKNQPAYYQQALVEVSILEALNRKYDPEDKHHIVRIYDYFRFQRHLCIAFEMLDSNLYELLKLNQLRGVTLNIVQLFSKQILRGLALMKDAAIIHCDLKPENILLCPGLKPPEIKIIDFGSACPEDRTVYSYIQSRYYRSPEVLLGYKYSTAIDMWSFGCIVAELFLGLPLFPGASSFDLLIRMIRILGGQPPDYLLKEAKNTSKFFKCIASVQPVDNGESSTGGRSVYQVLTEEEYEARELKKPPMGKEYFSYMNLEAIVTSYPYKKNLSGEDITKEKEIRLALADFLKGLVEFDPAKRWSPFQALKHPFVTGEPFTGPYKPPLETPHVPVSQNVQVDHHPGGGHWFAAGLSPHIIGMNRGSLHNSPHFQAVPYSYATSYGSVGSHGSYNDNIGIGSSYGSYGDNSNNFAYYSPVGPSAFNLHVHGGGMTFLGSSPDARRIISHFPHGGGGLGVSPSTGNFAPLPLDTCPVQFPSQGSYPASSPGHYGPTSPVRGSVHGSPLGKMAAAGNFNRRKSWGYSGNLQSQESSSQHWQGNFTDGSSSNQSNSYGSSWKQQRGDGGNAGSYHTAQNVPGSFMHGPGTAHEKPEHSLSQPDPADWFPNYSDDLLLQEDGSDANGLATEFSKGMHLDQTSVSAEQLAGAGRFNWATNPNPNLSNKRANGHIQASLHVGMGGPPSAHDPHNGYTRFMSNSAHFVPQIPTNFPSRLGQHSVPRLNHGGSTSNNGGEWNNIRSPPSSGFNTGSQGQHSAGNNQLNNGSSRGRRGNHPITHNLPTSHGRGRIS